MLNVKLSVRLSGRTYPDVNTEYSFWDNLTLNT